jgi:hypothetical protein
MSNQNLAEDASRVNAVSKEYLVNLLVEVLYKGRFKRLPDSLHNEVGNALFNIRVFGIKE